MEGRIARYGSEIISRRGYEEAKTWIDWARAPVTTGPYKVRSFSPDQELILDAHEDYWGGRPPLKRVRLVVVPEIASRVNGLFSGQFEDRKSVVSGKSVSVRLVLGGRRTINTTKQVQYICND